MASFVGFASAQDDDDAEPVDAILFPFFMITIGTLIYFLLSRLDLPLPYTAMCFLTGTIMGVGAARLDNDNILNATINEWWTQINSEVLLNAFLPGLIFNDSATLNFHLFQVAFWQCVTMAFPMVLGGTALTALVAYYIFPYDWSFDLAMTFGAILSATDPVAVAALLDEVGAPPRLKVHIGGESLMNDGSAIVFYTIFSQRYFYELGVDDFGEDIGVSEGFSLFFRMSLGGMAIGIFFGLGALAILSQLKRQLSSEENIVAMASIIGIAYLCYFTADVAW